MTGTELPLMTSAQYAQHRGVSDSYIRRLRREGRLITTPAGAIDAVASDAKLADESDPFRGGDRREDRAPNPAAPGFPPEAANTGEAGVREAARRERLAVARIRELELGELTKQLTRTKEVQRVVVTLVTAALGRLRAIGGRLRTQLAAANDPRECERLLDAEIRTICDEMRKAASDVLGEDVDAPMPEGPPA